MSPDGARQLMEQLRQRLEAAEVRRQQRRNRLQQADEPTPGRRRPAAGAAQFAFTASLNKVMFLASGNRRSCNAGRAIQQGAAR